MDTQLQLIVNNQSQNEIREVGTSELAPFLDKEYRDAYLDSMVKGGIAYQIQALREKSGLNQKQFGEKIGKPQSTVSRLEDTEYGAVTVKTLLDIARAVDVALEIRFSDYLSLLHADISTDAFKVDNVFESYKKCQIYETYGTTALYYMPVTQTSQAAVGLFNIPISGASPWSTSLPSQLNPHSFPGFGFVTNNIATSIQTAA